MKTGTIIHPPGCRYRLRFEGYQRELFGPELGAWTILAPGQRFHGRRVYARKGARAREVCSKAADVVDGSPAAMQLAA